MTFGWLNVIIEEGVRQKFVEKWTVGWDEFVEGCASIRLSGSRRS